MAERRLSLLQSPCFVSGDAAASSPAADCPADPLLGICLEKEGMGLYQENAILDSPSSGKAFKAVIPPFSSLPFLFQIYFPFLFQKEVSGILIPAKTWDEMTDDAQDAAAPSPLSQVQTKN